MAENVLPRSATRGLLTDLCKHFLGKVGKAALQEEQSRETGAALARQIQVLAVVLRQLVSRVFT